MSTGNDSELLTLAEVAEKARVKVSTVRAWRLERRNLLFVKLGGTVLVRREDLEAFIVAGIVPPDGKKRRGR